MVTIQREELKKLIDNKGNYILIDVREKNELEYGMIPTANHLPLSECEEAFEMDEASFKEKYGFELKKNNYNIFYCRSGSRSGQVSSYASSKGYNSINYSGSILDWSKIDPNVQSY